MGKLLLTRRLATRSMRSRPTEAVLTVLAIAAATATLTLGVALHGVISGPYARTRAVTRGPDIVAMPAPDLPSAAGPGGHLAKVHPGGPHAGTASAGNGQATSTADLMALIRARGVTGHSGPYPVSFPIMRLNGYRVLAIAEGRDQAPARIDQPYVTQGTWIRPGGVVIERGLADELGARVGERITLNGRPFRVAGLAVTAAEPAYPYASNGMAYDPGIQAIWSQGTGLIWLTRSAASSLATRADPVTYLLNLKLANQAGATAFANAHSDHGALLLNSWLDVRSTDSQALLPVQRALLIVSWLLGLLAIASLAVVVGGRITEQTRRTGLIKAVGGSPRLVASVLLAEYLTQALIAAAVGLAAGWVTAPLLTRPGAGLIGSPGVPPVTLAMIGWAVLLAVAVAIAAALVPSVRAAHASTTSALADAAYRPRRRALFVKAAARLPVPLLLGLRLAARRPRRMLLTVVSMALTVTTVVAVLTVHAHLVFHSEKIGGYSIPRNPNLARTDQVLLVMTIALILLAVVNTLVITWATAVDSRQPLAVARALGTSSRDTTTALIMSLLLPAVPGALAGLPLGVLLVDALSHGSTITVPPAWWLAAAFAVTLLAAGVLAMLPARLGSRQPVASILQAEQA